MSLELTLAISRLINGEDPQALSKEVGTELVEQAIQVMEARV